VWKVSLVASSGVQHVGWVWLQTDRPWHVALLIIIVITRCYFICVKQSRAVTSRQGEMCLLCWSLMDPVIMFK
jgi:hypothetical protein